MGFRDKARFYSIEGQELPSVTTILGVIDKSGPLMHWAVNQERKAVEAALLDVLTRPGAKDPEWVLDQMTLAVSGQKAWLRELETAASIGTALHAAIEWRLRKELGEDPGPEPVIPEPAAWAFEVWKDWAKDVSLRPIAIERVVYCLSCGYAGTLDLFAEVKGVATILDWKTGKAIYPEAFLQNVAYRHAANLQGLMAVQGMIVRLPKLTDDPAPEAMYVPETVKFADFEHAMGLWRWQRSMEGRRTGRKK